MINEKELRIGNIVYSDGDFLGKVESLGSDKASLYEKGGLDNYGYHRISGVPITELDLIEFGFETMGDYWEHKECYFEVAICEGSSKGEYINSVNGYEYSHGEPFKYIHELQNQCFALTKFELEKP